MAFGLGRGRPLDPAGVGVSSEELGPLPDEIIQNPDAARLDPRHWFQNPEQPLEIEIGAGKGAFLLDQAEQNPGVNLLGIEWAGEFYAYTADRVRRRGLANVRALHADAAEFLRWRCADAVARVIHLYFPDPWPKRKHHKKRIVQDPFLADIHRVLTPSGQLRVVTDHADYWAWMEEHFARWCSARPEFGGRAPFRRLPFQPAPGRPEGELVGTNFERKYRRQGRPFHGTILERPA